MSPLKLTFGIELEFVCVFPQHAFTDQYQDLIPNVEEDGVVRAGHAVIYHLLNSGIPAGGWESEDDEYYDEEAYSRWLVQTDNLHLSNKELLELPVGYHQESIEISSRIFRLEDPAWSSELERVLSLLHLMRHRYRCTFITNDTTGLHVHIGDDGGRKMPFQTVKRVFQLATAHERLFDRLHSANRITAPADFTLDPDHDPEIPRYAPLSFFHHSNWRGQIANPFDWLQQIEALQSPLHMGKWFEVRHGIATLSGHTAAVNFDNCCPDPDSHRHDESQTNTIEFRQHAGTLDHVEIRAYVSLLCSLVQHCHTVPDVPFIHLLLAGSNPSFHLADLLTAIGVHPDVLAHFHPADETATLGILPHPDCPAITQQEHLLARLTAQNDIEQSANLHPAHIAAKIEEKYRSGYYGWDPSADGLALSCEDILVLWRQCVEKVHVAGGVPMTQQALSNARSLLLMKVSAMYDDLDSALPDRLIPERRL